MSGDYGGWPRFLHVRVCQLLVMQHVVEYGHVIESLYRVALIVGDSNLP